MKKVLLAFVFILSACAGVYTTVEILPDRIRTVKVETFTNKTVLYGVEDRLYQKIVDKFLADGRLIPQKENADAHLIGEIKKYELIPLSFDENSVVEQYKLWLEAGFKFIDAQTGKVLYEEEYIPIDVRFHPPGSTVPGIQIQTETEAQEEAIEELASEIVYNILRYK
ncbi:MAG: LptE family protein [Elusimicrobia bacterium]|nr:LptE family protein [Elusimicrobiota bacterium]